jgi:hypothetical protein
LIIGVLGAVWSASGYVGAFGRAMNRIYEVEEGRPFWKLRPVQIAITLVMMILVSIGAIAIVLTGPLAEQVGNVLTEPGERGRVDVPELRLGGVEALAQRRDVAGELGRALLGAGELLAPLGTPSGGLSQLVLELAHVALDLLTVVATAAHVEAPGGGVVEDRQTLAGSVLSHLVVLSP